MSDPSDTPRPLNDLAGSIRAFGQTVFKDVPPVFAVIYFANGQQVTVQVPPAQGLGLARPPLSHSPDFHSVNWYGTEYTFGPTQAAIVELLWRAKEAGSPEVGGTYLVEQALGGHEEDDDADEFQKKFKRGPSIQDVFKGHPAFGKTMIIPGKTRGNFRLADPPG